MGKVLTELPIGDSGEMKVGDYVLLVVFGGGLATAPTRAGDLILPGATTYYVGTGSAGVGGSCEQPDFGANGGDATPTFAAAFAALIIAIAAIASATLRALMACYFPPAPAINKKNRPQFAHL